MSDIKNNHILAPSNSISSSLLNALHLLSYKIKMKTVMKTTGYYIFKIFYAP